jgi:hypothetical protein
MPETYREKISRILRDHQGYTGDGLGGVGDLPVGDRSTARKSIEKRDLREAFLDFAGVADVAQAAAESAAINAGSVIDRAWFPTVASLMGDNNSIIGYAGDGAQFLVAENDLIEAGGRRYQVAAFDAANHDLLTTGGVKLYDLSMRTLRAASIASGAQDGSCVILGGLLYRVDVTAVGIDSATSDLGVDGLVPAGEAVFPEHYGCVDGFGDNATKLDRAVNWARENGLPLDGRGRIYPITTAMTSVPGNVCNMTIDASGLTAESAWEATANEFEASQALTGDTTQGERLFICAGHGYSVGDVVLIQSNKIFETATNGVCSHWGKITSVTTDTFITAESALCNLTVSDSATVKRLPENTNSARLDFKMIGGANCGNGFVPIRFTDIEVKFSGKNFPNRNLLVQENYRPYISYVRADVSDASGLGYACGLAGNGWARVDLAIGLRCRHVVTTGASDDIPTVGGTVGDVVGNECLSAPLDTHPATLYFTQTGKTVADLSDEEGDEDGIVWQGVGGEFDVEFLGTTSPRHGVLVQPWFDRSAFGRSPSYHVRARGVNAADKGVVFDMDACGNIDTIECEVYGKSANEVVYVDIGPIAFEAIILSGRGRSTAGRAMRIICEATSDLAYVQQSGSWEAAIAEASYVFGATDAGSRTTEWSVSLCKSFGGTYGLRAANKVDAIVGAAFLDGSTGAASASPAPATVTVLT